MTVSNAWPPDYRAIYAKRVAMLQELRASPTARAGAMAYYATRPVEWISDWVDTYDPRNAGVPGRLTRMPFILFPRQRELVQFIAACTGAEANGIVEKCRDAGATWVACAWSAWAWLHIPGITIGWGSRKEQLVDRLGVMDAVLPKIRSIIACLPPELLPAGLDTDVHMTYMRIAHPTSGAMIVGEAGDNIGRGGRTRVYFVDEAAHISRPEMVEAALADNTRCRIDISSVCGIGTVFHRRREAGVEWSPGVEPVTDRANVFVFDWRHHPAKTQAWYDERRRKAVAEGLLAQFAQEVDRDYATSRDGIVILPEWVNACIDAGDKLGIEPTGGRVAGLDVADGGIDKSAVVARRGWAVEAASQWGDRDTGETTRRALAIIGAGPCSVQYDCIGVGAGVRAEANRLDASGLLPRGVSFTPWNAAASALHPDRRSVPGDQSSPLNKELFGNLKAQAWWSLRNRCLATYRMVMGEIPVDEEQLVSIPSSLPSDVLPRLIAELSQATHSLSSGTMRIVIDKAPNGARSPNLADAMVMAFFPAGSAYTLDTLG